MSQEERSDWRDNYFPSRWHRVPRLPEECFWMDFDAVEFRKDANGFLKPKGFFEYKTMWKFNEVMEHIKENNRLFWQLHLLKSVADKCFAKAYFIGYEYGDEENSIKEISLFNITLWRKDTEPEIKIMNEWEFAEFLQKL